jgi:ribosome-associated translation inhibitor RaiA
MSVPLSVTFRAVPRSEAILERIQHHLNKLEAHSLPITHCRVTVDSPHRHHRHGKHYTVCISLSVRGRELVINRDPSARQSREDLYASVDEAFAEARRSVMTHLARA